MTDQSRKADYKNGDAEDEVLKSKHHPRLNLKHFWIQAPKHL